MYRVTLTRRGKQEKIKGKLKGKKLRAKIKEHFMKTKSPLRVNPMISRIET